MSWLSLDWKPACRGALRIFAAWVLCFSAAQRAVSAEYYLQPVVTLTADANSNLDLDPSTRQWVEGYLADAATLIGVTTADSNTVIRPRLVYRYYPKETADDRLEGYLDLNSTYRTQRSVMQLSGTLEHQDEFDAEFAPPTYNNVNPVQPTPDTGKAIIGGTRDSVAFSPKYTYALTQVLGLGVSGQYQKVNYTPTDPSFQADYYAYQARGFASYSVTPRMDLDVGVYTSQYEATRFDARAIGTGETLDLFNQWSPLFSTTAGLVFQRTDIADVLPVPLTTTVDTWGAHAGALYKTLVDQLRVNAERSIAPSGGGGVYVNEKLQLQYDRNLTSRLSLTGALVDLRTIALASNLVTDNRRFAQALVEAHWMWTPTWFVQGGVQYAWQKYQENLTAGESTRIYIQVGYQGLGPQR